MKLHLFKTNMKDNNKYAKVGEYATVQTSKK